MDSSFLSHTVFEIVCFKPFRESLIKAMYEEASTKVRMNGRESRAFNVKVGVHQGSVLSPLLFIIVLEALSREFREGLPMELLYANDLVLITER